MSDLWAGDVSTSPGPAGVWVRANTTPWDWPPDADLMAQAAATKGDER